MSGVVVKVTENKLIVTKEDKKVRITAPYVDNHYDVTFASDDATFASDAETLAGTETTKAVSPASLASTKDVEGGFASKDYADSKITQTITEDVEDTAPSEGTVFDALALKANVSDIAPEIIIRQSIDNLTYDGVDLTTKFAAEIAGYSDVWAWIKARITAADYNGLNIGDYIPFSMGGNAIKAQIAGIDTYYRANDVETGHHIDFISKDCYPTPVKWNTTDVNNGNATNAAPWMVCNLKNVINTTWYNSLPTPLKAQIIEKRTYIERRYTSGSTLTDATGGAWNDIGKLWVPSEGEVYGTVHWGTRGYSSVQNAEYPIFAASWRNRIKGVGDGGPRCHWWLLSVAGGNSKYVCNVSMNGTAASNVASAATICAPVCFRIE